MITFLIILFVVIVIGCIVKSILKEDDDDDEKQTTSVHSNIPVGGKENEIKTRRASSKKYNSIDDFFKIDIRDIFKYHPKFSYEKENEYIKKVNGEIERDGYKVEDNYKVIDKYYDLRLEELELGTFYKIEILQSHNDSYWLTFEGRDNMLTQELYDFVNFCFEEYGFDDMGKGKIEESDWALIASNRFIRMWDNILLSMDDGFMTLRIYVDNSNDDV